MIYNTVIMHHRKAALMRTIIELPDKQLEALTRLAQARKVSRAEIIRQAVDGYLQLNAPSLEGAFGIWRGKRKPRDGVVVQRKLRGEWTR
jgi:predicted transcriptional regulator